MRALAVVHYSTFGGPHNRTAQVALELRKHGVETIVAIPDEPGTAYDRLVQAGLEVHRLPLYRLRRSRDPRVQFDTVRHAVPGVRALRKLIRARDIDVVDLNAMNAPHLGLAPRLEHTPLVWELIDTFPSEWILRTFMPLVCRWSDVIMSTGAAVAEVHPGAIAFGDRLVLFFPCVDMARFTAHPQTRARVRAELGIDDDTLVVGSVGNINPMKGHHTFVRAAAAVRRARPDTRFVLLGASYEQFPGYLEGIVDLAESLGLQVGTDLLIRDPGTRVHELAQAFDVFWMTSEPRSEGIPTAIGEAMALQLPVVAGNVGAIAECVIDGTTGFVVAGADPDAMVEPTLRLLADPPLRAEMGVAARRRAEQTYATAVGAEQHLLAYRMAIDLADRPGR